MSGGLGQLAENPVGDAEVVRGRRLAFVPPGPGEQVQRAPVVVHRVAHAALPGQRVGEVQLSGRLCRHVATRLGCGEARARDGQPVRQRDAQPEVAAHRVGQVPGCR